MTAEQDFGTDILDSNSDGEHDLGDSESAKMSGVLSFYRGVERLGSDKYISHDEEDLNQEKTDKRNISNFLSRKKKVQIHVESGRKKGPTTRFFSISKRHKEKKLNKKLKSKNLSSIGSSSPAAAAPVRLSDILGDVRSAEYSSESWRNKVSSRNIKTPTSVELGIQTNGSSDEEVSVLSSKGSKESHNDKMLQIRSQVSDDGDRHKGYMIADHSQCEDAIRDETETAERVITSRRDGVTEGTKKKNIIEVKLLDKYIVPSALSFEKSNLAIATRQVLLQSSIVAARTQKWDNVIRLVSLHPEILRARCHEERNQTLLHIIAGGDIVAKKVAIKIVNAFPEAVSFTDDDGCLPLHHAASVEKQKEMVKVLLESWPEGASIPNIDGDLPLHVSSWGGVGYEDICNTLMNTYSNAVKTPNNSGGLPLHMACCKENASAVIVKRLIDLHKNMDISITHLDKNGNSPLHVAIKTKAPHEIIEELFHRWGTTEAFSQQDGAGMYPLHMALILHEANPKVIDIISKAAPSTITIPLKDGLMPARLAIERLMPGYIVKDLVLADMPVRLGNINNYSMSEVIFQRHNHSWWFLGIRHDKYKDVIDEIFTTRAKVPEIIALAQVTDPNGTSTLFDEAHSSVQDIIKKHLRFCERYELVTLKKAKIIKGVLMLRAIDHGKDINWEEIESKHGNNPKPCNNGYTTVDYDIADTNCFEVILYDRPERDVILHCCPEDSDVYDELMEEIQIRTDIEFSQTECQRLFNSHVVDGERIGCPGDIICLAFERPLMTLNDIFESSRFRRRKSKEWACKSCNLLKRVVNILKYLHEKGFVHGNLGPMTIAKFNGENNWKLTDIGKMTPLGSQMRGDLRTGVPPESVSRGVAQNTDNSGIKKLVSFDDSAVDDLKTTKHDKNSVPNSLSLAFTPQKCIAAISWDIWSLGLVMGQLLLGQSMIYLPNFENATDAHLKNLYNYDKNKLQKIGNAARGVAGEDASNLLVKLLQPSPKKRPKSMDEILEDRYFTDELDDS